MKYAIQIDLSNGGREYTVAESTRAVWRAIHAEADIGVTVSRNNPVIGGLYTVARFNPDHVVLLRRGKEMP